MRVFESPYEANKPRRRGGGLQALSLLFDHSVVGLEAAPGRRAGKLPKICSGKFDIAFRGVFNNVQFVPFGTCVVFGCVKKSVTLQGGGCWRTLPLGRRTERHCDHYGALSALWNGLGEVKAWL